MTISKRFENAAHIWGGGACNPRGVARALVEAIDEACTEGNGHDAANDPAVHLIMDHLCFIVGLPQPSLSAGYDYNVTIQAVKEKLPEGSFARGLL